jgi:hypothetical protein
VVQGIAFAQLSLDLADKEVLTSELAHFLFITAAPSAIAICIAMRDVASKLMAFIKKGKDRLII